MEKEKFEEENRRSWPAALANVAGNNPPVSATWRDVDSIRTVLRLFMGEDMNHAHLPTNGGLDVVNVCNAPEPDCLEFEIDDQVVMVAKPESLTLEYFPASPTDSFLLLELTPLKRTGKDRSPVPGCEQLVELAPGEYVDRGVWDDGHLGYDEKGEEIPLPDKSRLVMRYLEGKILFVAKKSKWNRAPVTYDGRHNNMDASQIRTVIERARPI